MQVANQLGVGLGQFPEGAMKKLDARGAIQGCVFVRCGLETQAIELLAHRGEARPAAGAFGGASAPRPTGGAGGIRVGSGGLGQRGEESGEQDMGRWIEPEAGRTGSEEVLMLWSSDGAAMDRFDLNEPRVAQSFQMQANGVGVETEGLGEVRGGARRR